MSTLLQDIRYGLRQALRTPVVSAVAALSLALGIAANASMFAILDSFFLEPLPFGDQESLALFREVQEGEDIEMSPGSSIGNVRDYTEASRLIEGTGTYTVELSNLTGLDVPEQLHVVVATPNLFDVLRVQPSLGRGFRPEEGAEGSGNVVVLEHDYWMSRFLGDREILGQTMRLDGTMYTVVGVMPPEFDMIPANVQAFRPTDFRDQWENREARGYISFARLQDGATAEQLQTELAGVSARLATEFPDANRGWELLVQPARKFFPGPTDTKLFQILTVVTLFGLLIACANVANLLLARAEGRQKEVAVRKALGAARNRLLRQLLTESVLLALAAGIVGATLAFFIVGWLQGAMPVEMPRSFVPRLDLGVLLVTMAVAGLAGVIFGLVPALHATGGDLREALGEGARGGTAGRRRKTIRNIFVVGEFAVALALLVGSGFLMEAFNHLSNQDPGFNPDGLLTFQVSALEERYVEDSELIRYQDELIRTLEGIPGVEGVAVMSSLPRSRGNPDTRYTVAGRPILEESEQPTAGFQVVNPAYFATLDITVRQGRAFESSDREDSPPVAMVSQAWVDREFPGEDAIGKMIEVRGTSREIVGVVRDISQERIALAGRNGEAIYVPAAQFPLRTQRFALRVTAGEPGTLAADVRTAVWSVEPDQPIAQLRTLQAHIDESLAGPRSLSIFLGAMGFIALLLAAMGIYGVMAHGVAQQQKEIGIRMALGAGRNRVVGMVTRSGMTLALAGMLLGLPLAFLMGRAVSSALNLFEAELGMTYVFWVSGALVAVALLSTYLPARRASRIQPVAALKD
jgi:putative ABC transport system permease protein